MGNAPEALRAQVRLAEANNLPEVLVDNLLQLARWLEAEGANEEALKSLETALQVVQDNGGLEDDVVGGRAHASWTVLKAVMVKRDIAMMHVKLGRYEEALGFLNDVHYLQRSLYGSRANSVGRTLKALGAVHLLRQDLQSAEQCLLQALHIFEAEHRPDAAIIRDIHAKLSSIATTPSL